MSFKFRKWHSNKNKRDRRAPSRQKAEKRQRHLIRTKRPTQKIAQKVAHRNPNSTESFNCAFSKRRAPFHPSTLYPLDSLGPSRTATFRSDAVARLQTYMNVCLLLLCTSTTKRYLRSIGSWPTRIILTKRLYFEPCLYKRQNSQGQSKFLRRLQSRHRNAVSTPPVYNTATLTVFS